MEKLLQPKLRFPEFDGEWIEYRLSSLLTRYSESNRDEEFTIDDILSLSSHHGIVSRKELLEDTYNDVNHLAYKKTRLDDIVYGKSISVNFPYGLFKSNNYKDGLLSTLYFTYRVSKKAKPKFIDCYFSHINRANNFLRKYVLVGDRYITADSNYLLRGKVVIPNQLPEQQKIADYFTTIDRKIALLEEKKVELSRYKKAMMQKLFSQELRFKDDNSNDFPDWEEKRLGEVATRVKSKNKENNQNILTISAQNGLINQFDYFNNQYASKDVTNYYLIEKGDFAYNKSYSKGYPYGAIKRLNKYQKGVLSTLYICFRFAEKYNASYFEQFFDSGKFNLNLYKICVEGARNHGLLNVSIDDFFNEKIKIPSLPEQQKIADFLSSIDESIDNVSVQLCETQRFKKAMLQQMFV